MCPLDKYRARAAKWIEHHIVLARLGQPCERGRARRAQRSWAMGSLVLAMPHPVVAEPHSEKKLRVDHRRPQLDVGVFFFQPPGVILALENPALDCALKIDASIFVLTGHPGDHAEFEPAAGAPPLGDLDSRPQTRLDERRPARRAANFIPLL